MGKRVGAGLWLTPDARVRVAVRAGVGVQGSGSGRKERWGEDAGRAAGLWLTRPPRPVLRRLAGARRHRRHRHRRPAGHLRGAGARGGRAEKVFRLLKRIKGPRCGSAAPQVRAPRVSLCPRVSVSASGVRGAGVSSCSRGACGSAHAPGPPRARGCVRGPSGCGSGHAARSGPSPAGTPTRHPHRPLRRSGSAARERGPAGGPLGWRGQRPAQCPPPCFSRSR